MPRVEVSGTDIEVMLITRRLFDVLDGRPSATPVDVMRALLAARNVFASIGLVAIDNGVAAEAESAEILNAIEMNRATVLRIVDELRELIAAHQPGVAREGKSRIVMN